MSQIEVSIYDQTAVFTSTPDIFSGDVDVDKVKFTFDSSWNVYNTKTAIFYNDPKKSYPVFLDNTNTAIIPSEVIDRETKLHFGVIGTNSNNNVKTSSILSYRIERGAISADTEIPSSSAEVWLQILLNYEIALKKLNDMSNNLENMNNALEEMDQRFIDADVENKANISLDNLNTAGINKLLSEVNMDTIKDGSTYSKYYIQSGTVSITSSMRAGSSITFPKAFKSTPLLALAGPSSIISGSSNPSPVIVTYGNLSSTGFTLYPYGTSSGSYNSNAMQGVARWIAFGKI